jgi:AmiR/NasT family two-component response regulator
VSSPSLRRPDRDPLDATSWTEQVERMDPADLRMLALSMPLIEQAKGILMGHYGCDAATAFTVLRRWSSVRQLRLRDLAASLVERFLTVHGLG